jgi:hypothetical protein
VAELDGCLAEACAIDGRGGLIAAACADADTPQWSDLVLKAWASDRVKAARDDLPAHLHGGHVDDNATERLNEALEAQALAARHRVLERADSAPLLKVAAAGKYARRTPEQAVREKLQHETSRQRSLPPLRTFVRNYAEHGLFDAIPVWLLSPETLAVLFPRKPVFDVVIFDEASQCTVANGFPALLRARRVAIAGHAQRRRRRGRGAGRTRRLPGFGIAAHPGAAAHAGPAPGVALPLPRRGPDRILQPCHVRRFADDLPRLGQATGAAGPALDDRAGCALRRRTQ